MNRRVLLTGGLAVAGFGGWFAYRTFRPLPSDVANAQRAEPLPNADVTDWAAVSEDEWRERLTPVQFRVMREEGTERAFTSPLADEHREGVYHCAGCDLDLFSSEAKFDSGTGWPSFWEPIAENRFGFNTDYRLWYPRLEYHCSRCGGHHGHVFEDGPPPTGLRYCNNGVALAFRPATAETEPA